MADDPLQSAVPATIAPPRRGVWRVGRGDDPLRASVLEPADALLERAGNRFDIPGVGVRYFATEVEGCYAETLARFRPSAAVLAAVGADSDWSDRHFMDVGSVPADWRARRQIVRVVLPARYPLVDIESPDTHRELTRALAPSLDALGITSLDVATVRGPDRRVTRLLAQWAYRPRSDYLGYSGLRYVSRLGDWECWAVFEDVPFEVVERKPIELTDPALQQIAVTFGLRVH